MFSSRAPKLIGAALMDLAEAMLRPVDDEELERTPRPDTVDDWFSEPPFTRSVGAETTYVAAGRDDRSPARDSATKRDRAAAEGDRAAEHERVRRDRRVAAPHPLTGDQTTRTIPQHARPARIDRRRRRPGALQRPTQPCTSPLPQKPAAAPHTQR
jgi:hypothetical protein